MRLSPGKPAAKDAGIDVRQGAYMRPTEDWLFVGPGSGGNDGYVVVFFVRLACAEVSDVPRTGRFALGKPHVIGGVGVSKGARERCSRAPLIYSPSPGQSSWIAPVSTLAGGPWHPQRSGVVGSG